MLSTNHPLSSLRRHLGRALAPFNAVSSEPFGRPEFVKRVASEAERVFQGIAKASPSEARVYAAARSFVRGQPLDDYEQHLLACGLSLRIREVQNASPLGRKELASLLARFEAEVKSGDLWRLTWFNLLTSYFAFDPTIIRPGESEGFAALRAFLERTWPDIERQNRGPVVPEWVDVLRREPQVLGVHGAQRYAAGYLDGNDDAVRTLAEDLGIPESSWFWHSLVKHCVDHAVSISDDRAFRALVPRLIGLIRERPAFRDESLVAMLERCVGSADRSPLPALRDYVINKDVWKNPKLKPLGRAPAWNSVSDAAWVMVVAWVNEGLLRDFFQILAGQHGTDEGRLDFWSRYIEQISWTRLCIGWHTQMLTNVPEIRALIAREEGTYATIGKNLDAFVAQLGRYIVVEFSTTGNAAYIYYAEKVPFDLYAGQYSADTTDLKRGFYGDHVIRVTHSHGWQDMLEQQLKGIGIFPDAEKSQPRPWRRVPKVAAKPPKASDGQPPGAPFTMQELRDLVLGFARAKIDDRRGADNTGRLRVFNPAGHLGLERKLKEWGFRQSSFPREYYYPLR